MAQRNKEKQDMHDHFLFFPVCVCFYLRHKRLCASALKSKMDLLTCTLSVTIIAKWVMLFFLSQPRK
jgi:hypothetical protein